jgi:MoaD family protein
MTRVRVRLFASARETAGRSVDEVECADPATVGTVLRVVAKRYGPDFEAVLATARVWVNGDEPNDDLATVLADNDEVAVLPPVSGGI